MLPDTVDIPKDDSIELLELCPKTYFAFEGITYDQVKWISVGPPILSLKMEAVLQELDKAAFRNFPPA